MGSELTKVKLSLTCKVKCLGFLQQMRGATEGFEQESNTANAAFNEIFLGSVENADPERAGRGLDHRGLVPGPS